MASAPVRSIRHGRVRCARPKDSAPEPAALPRLNWNLTKGEAVIVVSHQGNSVYEKLLEEVEGIDIVVGAHSRDLITPPERVGGG